VPVFAKLWPIWVRVRVRFTTGAVRSAILATAGLLVCIRIVLIYDIPDDQPPDEPLAAT